MPSFSGWSKNSRISFKMESVLKLKLWSPTPSKGPGPRPAFDSAMTQTMKGQLVGSQNSKNALVPIH